MLKWIANRLKPADPAAALARAQGLRGQGRTDAAREACEAILRDAPGHVGTLVLMAALAADEHQFDAGVQWARQALAADRECVPAHFALGRLYEGQERHAEAEASYRRVVLLDSGHAKGHTNLGCMLHLQGRMDEAVACYRRALALEPGQPEALRNYALLAGGTEQLREARDGFERHLAAHPGDAGAHHQLGNLYVHLGEHGQALAAYDRALALQPEQPEIHFARAQLLLLLGRYAEGWREYEWRWRMDYLNAPMRRFPQPPWDGRPLEQGTLLVHSEPAFGDVLQLARYITLAAQRCARVVVECPPALAELMAGVEGVAQVVREGEPVPAFDAHIPPIAFPFVFGTAIDTIPWRGPYLHADPQRVQHWLPLVSSAQPRKRKVGVVWTGNPQNLGNRERSVTLQQFAPLGLVPGVSLFSLQKGGESARPGPIPDGMHFVDLTASIRDFSDTAALLTQLDLVITVDTSVAHLAGGMGRPTWVLLPFSADWRYHVDRSDNPWYPQMRLFRQQTEGDWSLPLQELTQALQQWAAT